MCIRDSINTVTPTQSVGDQLSQRTPAIRVYKRQDLPIGHPREICHLQDQVQENQQLVLIKPIHHRKFLENACKRVGQFLVAYSRQNYTIQNKQSYNKFPLNT